MGEAAKTTKENPMNKPSTTDKMLQTREGLSAEGGAIMLEQVVEQFRQVWTLWKIRPL